MQKYIYFFKEDEMNSVKIGISYNVSERLSQIQMCAPQTISCAGVMPGNLLMESEIHDKFSHLRIHGEWFRLDEELSEFIKNRTCQEMAVIPNRPKKQRRRKRTLKRVELKI